MLEIPSLHDYTMEPGHFQDELTALSASHGETSEFFLRSCTDVWLIALTDKLEWCRGNYFSHGTSKKNDALLHVRFRSPSYHAMQQLKHSTTVPMIPVVGLNYIEYDVSNETPSIYQPETNRIYVTDLQSTAEDAYHTLGIWLRRSNVRRK